MERLAAEVRRLSDMVEDLAHTRTHALGAFPASPCRWHTTAQTRHCCATGWTQEEVAAQIGTVRDVVGRVLRTFAGRQRDGLIRRERGRLVVMDRAGLERQAMK